jgi:hypothetical protein
MPHVPEVPPKLVEMAKRGKCVAFVGAGLSMSEQAPSWEELMTGLIDFAIAEHKLKCADRQAMVNALKSRGPEIVADALQNVVGDNRFRSFVDGELQTLLPEALHSAIVGPPCPFRAVFTTNYDCLIEEAYRRSYSHSPRVVTPHEIGIAKQADERNEFYVMKLHGCITRENLVLTRPEFIDLEQNHPYGDFVMAQFMSNSFLFIGHSLSDDDTKRSLERLGSRSASGDARHYCLMRQSEIHPLIRNRLSSLYGLEFLEYEDHGDIIPFLKELVRLVYGEQLSRPLKNLIPALGWILKKTAKVNGQEVLLCKHMGGNVSSTVALAAVPEDATDQMIERVHAAAAQCLQDEVQVVRVPWMGTVGPAKNDD